MPRVVIMMHVLLERGTALQDHALCGVIAEDDYRALVVLAAEFVCRPDTMTAAEEGISTE